MFFTGSHRLQDGSIDTLELVHVGQCNPLALALHTSNSCDSNDLYRGWVKGQEPIRWFEHVMDDSLFDEFGNYIGPEEAAVENSDSIKDDGEELEADFETGYAEGPIDRMHGHCTWVSWFLSRNFRPTAGRPS